MREKDPASVRLSGNPSQDKKGRQLWAPSSPLPAFVSMFLLFILWLTSLLTYRSQVLMGTDKREFQWAAHCVFTCVHGWTAQMERRGISNSQEHPSCSLSSLSPPQISHHSDLYHCWLVLSILDLHLMESYSLRFLCSTLRP